MHKKSRHWDSGVDLQVSVAQDTCADLFVQIRNQF
jgi:hypothetical protein